MPEQKGYTLTSDFLDEMRDIEGFPTGMGEDIIALSDPPHYTACPNPWVEDFIKEHGKPYDEENDCYQREPFAFDVKEGKNDPIYNAHSYHTKVPHKAIMRYILHYTEPGDIVFDGFCGTGMTGVAAQMCETPDPEFKKKIDEEMPDVKWGARKAILNDLSPAATFIAYNYNTPVDVKEFENEAKRILSEVEEEYGWMYETNHTVDGEKQYVQDIEGGRTPVRGRINYTVWSDIFVCPDCTHEIIFWDAAVDKEAGKVRDEFECLHCGARVTKRSLERAWESVYDDAIEETIKHAKQVPVLINYTVEGGGKKKRYEKMPDEEDLALIKRIEEGRIPYGYPTDRIPDGYNTKQPKKSHGVTHVHHFYTKRNLWALSAIIYKGLRRNFLGKTLSLVISINVDCSRMGRLHITNYFKGGGGAFIAGLPGTLYVSSISVEKRPTFAFENRIKTHLNAYKSFRGNNSSTVILSQSCSNLENTPTNSIDYIFTDPPFGGNLMYSELNFLWEAWLRVFTNNREEAVINNVQRKGLPEYQHIMESCFSEYYRVLKPGRWMTVEFHNSKNSVWMAIQEALSRAGFIVADVRTLDKQQGSFKQVTSASAVKHDLIISAYKPNGGLEERFKLEAGTEEGVWDFVRQHLRHLPVFAEKDDKLEIIADRQNFLLFDRMVAFHVQRGIIVPISAGDFYAGLHQRFPERDGMYFLSEDVVEYDRRRLTVKRVEQLSLTVHDEKSTVQWLRQELLASPQTYQDIQPKFLQQLHQDRHEKLPELMEVLEENFLKDEEGRWYIPDPNKQSDLEKLREKSLFKEFATYREGTGKLKQFRTEAVRAGFKRCWAERDYGTIVSMGARLPPLILQEDSTLLMYSDNAITRGGDA
ncbi:MAG: DNA methyltransferase [Candidatus Syntropharchaeales archaeon]